MVTSTTPLLGLVGTLMGGEDRVTLTSASGFVMCSPPEMSATGDGSIEVAGRKDGGSPARYLCLYGCRRKIELGASTDIVYFGEGRKRLYCQV